MYNIITATKPDAPGDANANARLDDVKKPSRRIRVRYIVSAIQLYHISFALSTPCGYFIPENCMFCGQGGEGENTNVRDFLDSKRLSVVWMQEQLKQRGYDVDLSHLCRILKGQRCSEQALRIVEEAKAICAKYESL